MSPYVYTTAPMIVHTSPKVDTGVCFTPVNTRSSTAVCAGTVFLATTYRGTEMNLSAFSEVNKVAMKKATCSSTQPLFFCDFGTFMPRIFCCGSSSPDWASSFSAAPSSAW